jgi:uncharacterized small protein (DUF1192 family)
MANYDDFVKKAKGAFDTLADASVDAYKIAEEKARILAKKTKLRAGIVNEKAIIRRVSVDLGTKYYNKYKNDTDAEFSQLCEEITCAFERIALKEEEIASLKTNTEKAATEKTTCADDNIPLLESADIIDDQ